MDTKARSFIFRSRLTDILNFSIIRFRSFFTALFLLKDDVNILIKKFAENYQINSEGIFFTKNGRSAISLFFKSLGIKSDDEIIIASYNCFVVPQAVLSSGALPIYIDINENLQIDSDKLLLSISKNTKCIVVPLHDGLINISDIEKIIEIAKKNRIHILIDAAHCMPTKSVIDLFSHKIEADGIIFSFSHSKNFSLMCGGLLILNSKSLVEDAIKIFETEFLDPKIFEEIIRIINLFLWTIFARLPILDILIRLIQRYTMKPEILQNELTGQIPDNHNNEIMIKYKIALLIRNLDYFDEWVDSRKKNYNLYKKYIKLSECQIPTCDIEQSTPLQYPIYYSGDINQLINVFYKNNIYVNRWFFPQMFPRGEYNDAYNYIEDDYPSSKKIASKIINLPTSPKLNENDIQFISSIINSQLKKTF